MIFTNENTIFQTHAVQILLLYCIFLNPVGSMFLTGGRSADGLGAVVRGMRGGDNLNSATGAGKLGGTLDTTRLGDTGTTTLNTQDLTTMRDGRTAMPLKTAEDTSGIDKDATKFNRLDADDSIPKSRIPAATTIDQAAEKIQVATVPSTKKVKWADEERTISEAPLAVAPVSTGLPKQLPKSVLRNKQPGPLAQPSRPRWTFKAMKQYFLKIFFPSKKTQPGRSPVKKLTRSPRFKIQPESLTAALDNAVKAT
ncbi:hypothetical protein PtA15_4A162 [Puccinia triticina]|uniref:Uncharacterized protein n=1 Tax=Puccinia triticina TaxID=208348 RepID=A0ABY7CES8_9BASI|nr:uncharacterized protein PtA15_4A162 [Puccinia triticina]WAQ83714.1 hypothetical protein PtA15_4A162 [Puccinia triticina]WAR54557.1 hypothetical protein PtB15_4B174 [Puccinia triticina]